MKSHLRNYSFEDYRREVFGGEEAMLKNVRAALKADPFFLTDGIILARLHSDIARRHSEDMEFMIYGNDEAQRENFRTYAFLNLLGSICHALASRSKSAVYSSYASTDWLKKSQEYYSKADILEISWRNGNGGKTKTDV